MMMTTLDALIDGSWIPTPEQLAQVEAVLPEPPTPVGSYVPLVVSDGMIYTSGALPVRGGQLTATGALGRDVSIESAQTCARLAALNSLALLKRELGSLSRVTRIVKLTGFVSSPADFYDQPKVINGASDLLVQVLGDAGRHARSAVGVAALPMNAPIEIDLVVAFA